MEIAERRASPSPSTVTGPIGPLMLAMFNSLVGLRRGVLKGFAKDKDDMGVVGVVGVAAGTVLILTGVTGTWVGFSVEEPNAGEFDDTWSISLY